MAVEEAGSTFAGGGGLRRKIALEEVANALLIWALLGPMTTLPTRVAVDCGWIAARLRWALALDLW